MKKTSDKNYIGGLTTLVIFAVFAACVVMVLVTGADIYKRVTDRDNEACSERIISQYISTRVREAESPDAVSVEEIDGKSVLRLRERINGRDYFFSIYLGSDGYIRELYAPADSKFYPDSGEKLIKADSLSFDLEDGILTAKLAVPGCEAETVKLSIRGRERVS
ncbi:MAG: DUF4860 domain-containing protein [Eubacteriales bacterium]|nr:DUF4860 domain-containing protein [Eubacteriales bacterium]